MADDKKVEPENEFEEAEEAEELELEPGELDEDELDEDVLEADEEFGAIDDDDFPADEEEDEEEDATGPVRRSVSEDEDEDEEMIAPDDVEADLDTILKDRLVTTDEEDEGDEDEPEEKGEAADRLQPKRADERLCPSCFLLVRQGAPVCPVGDDDCPLFR